MKTKTTELNLIPIFVAIYEEQNLSRAARRLSISQPAVSKALKRLREVYDDPLFHRTTNGVEPTSFGMDIYPAFSAALSNFNSTLSASRDFDPKTSQKTFSIASVSVTGFNWLNHLVAEIRDKAPAINLEVHPLFTQDYETDLRLQRYDLIIDIAPNTRSFLKHEPLVREEACVVYSKDHPRLEGNISKDEFFSESHVVLARWHVRGSLLGEEHIDELDRRVIRHRMPGAAEMLSVISVTDSIGILPLSTVNYFEKMYDLNISPLPFECQYFEFCSIWTPNRTHDSSHKWLRKQLKMAADKATTKW